MGTRRTDLALEAAQLWREGAGAAAEPRGVECRQARREGWPVTTVRIADGEGARALGKPEGTYVTLELDGLARREEDAFGRAARAVAAELSALLDLGPGEPVLVVGLGNRGVTPDSIGPLAAGHTLVTRHLVDRVPEHFGAFRPVAALAAGVLGATGVESGRLARAVVREIRPARVVCVDALAARGVERVCRTVQLADTGIVPGSGVGNAREALNADTLGVPVVAVGVPTVVDAATLARDLLAASGLAGAEEAELGEAERLFVTPRDIDTQVRDLARVVGYGINLALHPGLSLEDIQLLLD